MQAINILKIHFYLAQRRGMENIKLINFNYSSKNIPLPSAKLYKNKLTEKIESLAKRCNLCLFKKLYIIFNASNALVLNKRT